jgi:anti-sigma factor RsiW
MGAGRFDELERAYFLGALPEEDRRVFEEHLAEHPERRAEIDEMLTVADLMALRALRRESPPELKGRVVGALRGQARTRHPDRRRRPDGSGG